MKSMTSRIDNEQSNDIDVKKVVSAASIFNNDNGAKKAHIRRGNK